MGAKEKINKFIFFIRNKSYYEAIIRSNGNKIGEIIQEEPNKIRGGDFCLISKSLKKAWFKPFNYSIDNLNDEEILKLFGKTREELKVLQDNTKNGLVYTDGKRFVCILDVNDGIPLYEDVKTRTEDIGYLIKTSKTITLKEDKKEQKLKKKTGIPVQLKEIGILPSMLFELIEGNAVIQVNSKPPSKWEALQPVFIVLIIVIGAVFYLALTSGKIHGLG